MSSDKRKQQGSKARSEEEDLIDRLRSEIFGDSGVGGSGSNYQVGYRKPPVATRFKKGVSGNPAGRPKRKRPPEAPQHRSAAPGSAMRAIRQELTRDVVVQEAGASKKMSLPQAALRQLEQLAFKGSVNACKELLRLSVEEVKQRDAELAANHAYWTSYCEEFEANAQRFEKAGIAIPEWWPRPEDINIRPDQQTVIKGPRSPEELPIYHQLVNLRDACIAKTRYDAVVFPRAHSDNHNPHDLPMIGLLAYWIDLVLPKRMQLSPDAIYERMMDAVSTLRKDLEDELVRTFDKLGREAPLDKPGEPIGHGIYRLGLDPDWLQEALVRSRRRYRATGTQLP